MQGLLTATMWGLGLGCGTLVFGLVYDEFGPVGLYRTGVRLYSRATGAVLTNVFLRRLGGRR